MSRTLNLLAKSVVTATALALSAGAALAQLRAPAPAAPVKAVHAPQLVAESRSKQLCESVADRVFVQHAEGTECIAYFATTGTPQFRPTVFFLEGDIPAADALNPAFGQSYFGNIKPSLQNLAQRSGVRFVFVARPGVLGSSGNHAKRWQRAEVLSINGAIDQIKARIGASEIVLAGQSGGSTISSALLTLGRRDVTCAVLGSGAFSLVDVELGFRAKSGLPAPPVALLRRALFDPSERLAQVPRQDGRRIFVLADQTDATTPYPQQRAFAAQLRALGHHASLIDVMARGSNMHGTAHLTLPAAAHCARGTDEASIRRQIQPAARPVAGIGAGTANVASR